MQQEQWIPLTEYALRTGLSISTIRRKIKSSSIDFKMDAGKYLIRCDEFDDEVLPVSDAFLQGDAILPDSVSAYRSSDVPPYSSFTAEGLYADMGRLEKKMDESDLRWRAMEARVVGLAKKLEVFSEHISELKMLVKIFEEKMDNEK